MLGANNLTRNPSRSFVAVVAIVGGVAAFLLAGGFIEWILKATREATIHSQLGHIQIVRPGFFDRGLADPYSFLLEQGSDELVTIRSMPNVVSVTPRLVLSGLISRGETTLAFSGEGVDPDGERLISTELHMLDGVGLTDGDKARVLVGEGLARNLGVATGDAIVLLVSTARGTPNAVEAVVSGVFMTAAKDYDDYAVRLPIELARKLMRVQGATSWVVLLDQTEKTGSLVDELRARMAPERYQVVPWRDLADFYNKTEALFSKQVNVVKAIIALIIVLTIMNTLTMTVLERTAEIGTSLAIGVPGRSIVRLFVIEGLLIGIIGGVAGILTGSVLGMVISKIGIPMPPPPGMTHGYVGGIVVSWSLILDALILAVITTLAASLFPAWRAGRMSIVDALRYGQ
jgi:putative ABC transport system permease protein